MSMMSGSLRAGRRVCRKFFELFFERVDGEVAV